MWWLVIGLASLMVAGGAMGWESAPRSAEARQPRIFPDYAGVTIPPNIAPLNFNVQEPASRYRIKISSKQSPVIQFESRSAKIIIPASPWRALLRQNEGQPLWFEVSARTSDGGWQSFATITNTISRDAIDPYLAYRLLHSQFSMFASGTMGIYQRNLESYEQSPILELKDRTGGTPCCMNCHTFLNRQPDTLTLHLRSPVYGKPMVLVKNNQVFKVQQLGGYMSWHPSGKWIVYSMNALSLFFHSIGETRDVYDGNSDLAIYDLEANTVSAPPPISQPDRQETWPAWAPDGRALYYCSAPRLPIEQYRNIHYDLIRVGFDPASNTWGTNETLLSAKATGGSIAQPKPSPDGRFLVFTRCEYGSFPIYQSNSDLYLLDLASREYRRMELNSDWADSWHSWSSNSRWLVFSSKRMNGMLARPFFSHIDERGQCTRPFVLPQKDPLFYDSFIKTFNVPELIQGPVPVAGRGLYSGIFRSDNVLKPKVLTRLGSTVQPSDESTATKQ